MKRARRWIFNTIAAISLLLCTTAIGGWIQSYVNPRVNFANAVFRIIPSPRAMCLIISDSGQLSIMELGEISDGMDAFVTVKDRHYPGVEYSEFRVGTELTIDYWLLAVAFALFPIYRFAMTWRHRQRSKSPDGICRHCGYDLRATPDRCPECGSAAVSIRAKEAAP
jgi:hypothetical protein